jgi:enamine deaminase RidA (YjgF/YER057c/UK114 family)
MPGKIEKRLKDLRIVLAAAPRPAASYVPFAITGDLVFVSGQIPLIDGSLPPPWTGKVGGRVSPEQAALACRHCFINILAQLKAATGDLDRVVQVVRLGGFIAAGPDYTQHHIAMNGASDLAMEVFGEAGRHARSTIGVPSLPLDAAVEVEGVFRIA